MAASHASTAAAFLAAYDSQLRTDAEVAGALSVTPLGPLCLATFDGGRGFVTYADLGGAGAARIADWVDLALAHFRADPRLDAVEWKTRAHDAAPGLHSALLEQGFVPDDPESIMIGAATDLVADVTLPPGVQLRRITEPADVRAVSAMQDIAFGGEVSAVRAEDLLRRLECRDGTELWAAEHQGSFVSAGRLEPVAGTDFAGIWGGATLAAWRGRGIYRALTAERARSVLRLGKTLIHSDSTGYSRPILERYGLLKVSTTTPYNWTREA
ncbi:acetyltransferase [Arthrobacter sp. Leaf141]|uniref:acetyltransferase n=1 Tax=Arthrobacter sp. Leaf141 TaxID=1736273 RepID=UPI0006F69B36|nr:acetyltransferase [Arthrobacter sp. Leaf141]KQR00797.1 acetyltransferase [Arthrobacter sp. Leaf141]